MTRRKLLASLAAPLSAAGRRPDIILVVSDDHHWQCLGAAGNPHVKTPHLDALAQGGVNFRQAVISTSQCAPSRGILLSGQETYQTGLDSNGHTAFRSFSSKTVAASLGDSGYSTHLIGKWHISNSPRECGFTDAPVWLAQGGSQYRNPRLRHGIDASTDRETPGHITEIFTDAAAKVVTGARQPYFLWLTYNAPHTPWLASPQYMAMYAGRNAEIAPPAHPRPDPEATARAAAARRAGKSKGGPGGSRADGTFDWETYYAVISELDANIGRLVESVKKAGRWDNTLLLFLGDNGFLCGSKGLQGKVFPWEESIRVPFLAAGGLVSRASASDAPVASVDVPATILDVAGVKPAHAMAGTSFRDVLRGGRFRRDTAFSVWNDPRPEGLAAGYPVEPYRVARTPEWKYIRWESKKEALFDLRADPSEAKNLAGDVAHAARRKQLRERLFDRIKRTSDPAIAWM